MNSRIPILPLLALGLGLAPAHAAAPVISDNFNGYTTDPDSPAKLPTGADKVWNNPFGGQTIDNGGDLLTRVMIDTGNLFGQGETNQYLKIADTSADNNSTLYNLRNVATPIGEVATISFEFYDPDIEGKTGSGWLLQMGSGAGNSGSAFGLYFNNGSLNLAVNSSMGPGAPVATYSTGKAHLIQIVLNSSDSTLTYSNGDLTLDKHKMDVWLDGSLVATNLDGSGGQTLDPITISSIDFVRQKDTNATLYLDDFAACAAAPGIFDDFNSYPAGVLPTGPTRVWNNPFGGQYIDNDGNLLTRVTTDTGNLFGQGETNQYLMIADTSADNKDFIYLLRNTATPIGEVATVSFKFYDPVITDAHGDPTETGSGWLLQMGSGAGNSGSAFGLYFNNGSLNLAVNSSMGPGRKIADYSTDEAHSIRIVLNSSALPITCEGGITLDAGKMAVWLDDLLVGANLDGSGGKSGQEITLSSIDFVRQSDTNATLYLDDFAAYTPAPVLADPPFVYQLAEPFEAATLGSMWIIEHSPADIGNITLRTDTARAGNQAVRLVNNYDDPGTANERTEMLAGSAGYLDWGQEYWIGFSFYLKDWTPSTNSELVHQFHAIPHDSNWTGPIAGRDLTCIFINNDEMSLRVITTPDAPHSGAAGDNVWHAPVVRNVWQDWVIHVRLAPPAPVGVADSFLEVWRNGQLIYQQPEDQNGNVDSLDAGGLSAVPRHYLTVGVYNWPWQARDAHPEDPPPLRPDITTRTIYYDAIRIGHVEAGYTGGYDGVTPAR